VSIPISPDGPQPQLEVFRALPGDMAAREARDLMSYSLFSLAESLAREFPDNEGDA
jgi:plasmid replication initiation protein